jgi:endonuclease YncB( thermonuclease family)
VDAPEKAQPFGTTSRTCLGNLAYGCTVWVNVRDTDRYGRTVADVRLGPSLDSRHLNAEQVKRGMAWWYRKYAPRDTTLQRLEQEARTAKRGLWAEAKPTPPWEWRGK